MDLGLFKKVCYVFLFRAIFHRMTWSSAYKADFRNFSFKLLPSKKLPFFLPKSFFLFFCIMSLLSKIFFEMISFFLWTGTIFLIALYLQVFSPTIVFKFAMDLVNFRKKFPLITELFQSNEHMLINFSQGSLLQSYFFGDSSYGEFHLLMVQEGS